MSFLSCEAFALSWMGSYGHRRYKPSKVFGTVSVPQGHSNTPSGKGLGEEAEARIDQEDARQD